MDYSYALNVAKSLVEQMTVEEKISQLIYHSPAIERLGIKEYGWWNEAAHGVARAGIATVFPQAMGMAATFNPDLVKTIAEIISTEARAKYNKSVQFGDYDIYKGLTFWAPNINIFRDPRWGRGQETFGEDPFLTATLSVEYINGLQGTDDFAKSAACAKHFAVHSGPEKDRHHFNAIVNKKDMYETYLPAFEYAVKKGNVLGVMGAYNRTNGEPCCAHTELIRILREVWGFKGYFVSDCGAISDIYVSHKYTQSLKEAAALAFNKGCNLNCGEAYNELFDAYEEDMINEESITEAVTILYTIRAMLGEFEENRPFADIPYSKLDCDEHKELNIEAAKQCLVMLKNENDFLPIKPKDIKTIAVVGPNARSIVALEGNYEGHASEYFTVADGIRKVYTDSKIYVADGSHMHLSVKNSWDGFANLVSEGLAAASEADVTVLCLGLDRGFEGEEIPIDEDFISGGDRQTLRLPKVQLELAEKICQVCENVIIVVMCGSPVDLGEKINSKAKAIIHAWYPGAVGGLAIAELIAGKFSPSGRLPITFYKEENKIAPITDYSMVGRTYRFINEEPLFPFGYGLSYSEFKYSDFSITENNKDSIKVKVNVTNIGDMESNEKVQVYAQYSDTRTTTPNYQLCGVKSISLLPNETKCVDLTVDKYWLKSVLDDGTRVDPDGQISLYVGGHQPDERSNKLCGYSCEKIEI